MAVNAPPPSRPEPLAARIDAMAGWAHVGMMDGDTKNGRVLRFAPAFPTFLLQIGGRQGQSAVTMAINSNEVAYIGFLRDASDAVDPPKTNAPLTDVQVVGGRKFRVVPDPLPRPTQGFYGRPLDGPYSAIFFFARALSDPLPSGGSTSSTGTTGTYAAVGKTTPPPLPRSATNALGVLLKTDSRTGVTDEQLQKRKRMRLGEILVEEGLATAEDIEAALVEQKKGGGKRLGELLLEMQVLTEIHLAQVLSKKFNIPLVDLDHYQPTPAALREIPREMMEKYRVLPLLSEETVVTIAIADPMATDGIDAIRFRTRKQVNELLTTRSQLEEHLARYVGVKPTGSEEADKMGSILRELEVTETQVELEAFDEKGVGETDSGVIKLANQIILEAHRRGASDIHIEPNGKEGATLVRFRIDGDCYDYQEIPAAYRTALVARMKIMASLDISERRKPQDGKIRMKLGDGHLELRVATIPTVNGNEDVVMRLLAASKPLPVERLGLSPWNLETIKGLVTQPYGLILCVGPTGSGKTTTLHSVLGYINKKDIKIWTAEDPVEITQARLRQVQVNPKVGFTFAAALRSFLRADPDVVMIGEMRDHETAAIAVEASLTGHLVLSTLHTNSAPETITRLVDMGLDPFSFADALLGILAQRLARGICQRCKGVKMATDEEFRTIVRALGEEALGARGITTAAGCRLFKSKGCDSCNNTGYAGRVALHELLASNDELKTSIQHKAPVHELRTISMKAGMRTLLQDGVEKCLSGVTDLQQVMAVCSR